jgi:hypothetical protein
VALAHADAMVGVESELERRKQRRPDPRRLSSLHAAPPFGSAVPPPVRRARPPAGRRCTSRAVGTTHRARSRGLWALVGASEGRGVTGKSGKGLLGGVGLPGVCRDGPWCTRGGGPKIWTEIKK